MRSTPNLEVRKVLVSFAVCGGAPSCWNTALENECLCFNCGIRWLLAFAIHWDWGAILLEEIWLHNANVECRTDGVRWRMCWYFKYGHVALVLSPESSALMEHHAVENSPHHSTRCYRELDHSPQILIGIAGKKTVDVPCLPETALAQHLFYKGRVASHSSVFSML